MNSKMREKARNKRISQNNKEVTIVSGKRHLKISNNKIKKRKVVMKNDKVI